MNHNTNPTPCARLIALRRRLSALVAIALTLTACTPDRVLTDTDLPNTAGDPLALLPPETPVRFAAQINAFGLTASATRAADARTNLAAIPAAHEATSTTGIKKHDSGTSNQAEVTLLLPGSTYESASLTLSDGTIGDLNSSHFYIFYDDDAPITPRLKDFNLKANNADGKPQPHSRIALINIAGPNSTDYLMGIARLGHDDAGTTPQFTFVPRHGVAKLSILVLDPAGNPLNMAAIADGGIQEAATITVPKATPAILYTGTSPDEQGSYPLLIDYLKTAASDGTFPDDPAPDAAPDAIHLITHASESIERETYQLSHPASPAPGSPDAIPTNLLNILVPANPTHQLTANDTYLPFEATHSTLTLRNIVDNGTTVSTSTTYTLLLRDIALTGLEPDDSRRVDATGQPLTNPDDCTGHLLYLRPGEHLVLTLKVDRSRILSATATLGAWSEAGGDKDFTDEDEAKASLKLIEIKDGIRTYEVSEVDGLLALNKWLTDLSAADPSEDEPGATTIPTLEERLKTNITLTADITLPATAEGGSNWTPIGTSYSVSYTGTFDGAGHTVSGLRIVDYSTQYLGFFGYIRTRNAPATVKNLTVEGTIVGSYGSDFLSMGGIVGYAKNSTLSHCTSHVNVTYTGSGSYADIGGVVGTNDSDGTLTDGTLTACTNTGTVKGSTGSNSYTGGVAGYTGGSSTLIACTNTGTVTGSTGSNSDTGGIVGYNYDGNTLTACYSTGAVTGSTGTGSYTGGIAGYNNNNCPVTTCYWRYTATTNHRGIGNIESGTTTSGISIIPIKADGGASTSTWEYACGLYSNAPDVSNTSTLNHAIWDWNHDPNTNPAKFCPYQYELTGTSDDAIGPNATHPLKLVPINQ